MNFEIFSVQCTSHSSYFLSILGTHSCTAQFVIWDWSYQQCYALFFLFFFPKVLVLICVEDNIKISSFLGTLNSICVTNIGASKIDRKVMNKLWSKLNLYELKETRKLVSKGVWPKRIVLAEVWLCKTFIYKKVITHMCLLLNQSLVIILHQN